MRHQVHRALLQHVAAMQSLVLSAEVHHEEEPRLFGADVTNKSQRAQSAPARACRHERRMRAGEEHELLADQHERVGFVRPEAPRDSEPRSTFTPRSSDVAVAAGDSMVGHVRRADEANAQLSATENQLPDATSVPSDAMADEDNNDRMSWPESIKMECDEDPVVADPSPAETDEEKREPTMQELMNKAIADASAARRESNNQTEDDEDVVMTSSERGTVVAAAIEAEQPGLATRVMELKRSSAAPGVSAATREAVRDAIHQRSSPSRTARPQAAKSRKASPARPRSNAGQSSKSSSATKRPAPTSSASQPSFSWNDILRVQNMIERCLQQYLTKNEILMTLKAQAKVDPEFTSVVWQKLEEQNPSFFKAYNIQLQLKDQINTFNYLVSQQKEVMFKTDPSLASYGGMGMGGQQLPSLQNDTRAYSRGQTMQDPTMALMHQQQQQQRMQQGKMTLQQHPSAFSSMLSPNTSGVTMGMGMSMGMQLSPSSPLPLPSPIKTDLDTHAFFT